MRPKATERAPLAELIHRELPGTAPEEAHARGRERLLLAAVRERSLPRRRNGRPLLLLVAAALALVGAWAVTPFVLRTPVTLAALGPPTLTPASLAALTFEVVGGANQQAEAFIDAAGGETPLAFSDGSRVVFAQGARGRVAETTPRGARVVLSSGVVDLDVVHRDVTSWSVEAGPHVVRVTGTSFRVRFEPERGHFEVQMKDGRVIVSGPGAPDGLPVVRGQVIVADPPGGYRIAEAAAAPEPASPEVAGPAPQRTPSSGSSAAVEAQASQSWTDKVSRGEYQAVVDEANARGLENVAGAAPLGDLVALADAARYTKSSAVARRALEAQRSRFGDTTAGRTATFLLGRIAEDSDKNLGRALELYDAYLATGGGFASEALGRKMMIVSRTKGGEAALPLARAYLQAYPKGAYASVARDLGAEP